jgi:hypothetical protein
MKRSLLLTFIALFAAAFSYSQITITSGDMPSPGDGYNYASDENPTSVSPGSPGGNQSWDFTGLTEDFTSSTQFVTPGSTPFSSLFPEANLATNSADTIFTYMHVDSDEANTLGLVIESEVTGNFVNNYVPGETFANFPLEYQDEWTDEYYWEFFVDPGVPGIDSFRYKSDVTRESVVDAWGTVSIPMGTFNALRINEMSTSIDSTWAKVAGIWMLQFTATTTNYFYEWWTNEAPVAPFVASMSSPDNFTTIDEVTWVKDVFVGVPEDNTDNVSATIYPNPASEHITIETGIEMETEIIIMDNTGRVVAKEMTDEKGVLKMSLPSLARGIYTFMAVFENEISSGRFIIDK